MHAKRQMRVALGEKEFRELLAGKEVIILERGSIRHAVADIELHLILSDIGFAAIRKAVGEICGER